MPPETTVPQDGAALARFVADHVRQPQIISLSAGTDKSAAVMVLPDGYKPHDLKPFLDKFATAPERREGETLLTTVASFVAWVNRHRDDGSMIYAEDDMSEAKLVAVIDHDLAGPELAPLGETHEAHRARYGRSRGRFDFPFSRPWQEWMKVAGPDAEGMKTRELAIFLERRIGDVLPPPTYQDGATQEIKLNIQDPEVLKLVATLGKKLASPSELVTLSKGISVNVDSEAEAKYDLDSGEISMVFRERNGMGTDKVKVPNLFLIDIPVLNGGDRWMIAVHLRYRTGGGSIVWHLEMHQPERVFEETLETVEKDTELAPLRGIAPAAR